jgi:hypothetical protein
LTILALGDQALRKRLGSGSANSQGVGGVNLTSTLVGESVLAVAGLEVIAGGSNGIARNGGGVLAGTSGGVGVRASQRDGALGGGVTELTLGGGENVCADTVYTSGITVSGESHDVAQWRIVDSSTAGNGAGTTDDGVALASCGDVGRGTSDASETESARNSGGGYLSNTTGFTGEGNRVTSAVESITVQVSTALRR